MKALLTAFAIVVLSATPMLGRQALAAPAQSGTFKNPLLPSGADPWVTYQDGFYYYMNSTGNNLTIWKTRNMADLATAERKVVWTPPATGPYAKDIWAPELHRIQGKWYIYFAADAGDNDSHRVWVVENASADPMQGTWTFKGKAAHNVTGPGFKSKTNKSGTFTYTFNTAGDVGYVCTVHPGMKGTIKVS